MPASNEVKDNLQNILYCSERPKLSLKMVTSPRKGHGNNDGPSLKTCQNGLLDMFGRAFLYSPA
jgi:hypothetical protein